MNTPYITNYIHSFKVSGLLRYFGVFRVVENPVACNVVVSGRKITNV